uniref:Uncharacterized protein n=1 Tax=Ciona savignyi TaxID=51511 RepID=H2YHZ5_CIOSA
MASEKQNKLLKKKNSKSKTNTSEMAHIMKGWHSAVYHKSVFTLSNDLANENT